MICGGIACVEAAAKRTPSMPGAMLNRILELRPLDDDAAWAIVETIL